MAYVDKEKFKRKLQYIFKTYRMSEIITEKVKHALDDTTVDAVEVVRCKDCKYCNEYQKFNFERYLGCNTNGEIYEVEPNHFCSYGKRKEDV